MRKDSKLRQILQVAEQDPGYGAGSTGFAAVCPIVLLARRQGRQLLENDRRRQDEDGTGGISCHNSESQAQARYRTAVTCTWIPCSTMGETQTTEGCGSSAMV
jgi:hypothetical protein